MTIKTRILLAIISIGVIPLLCASAIISYSTSGQINVALHDAVSAKLVAVREMKKDQLNSFFDDLKTIVQSFGNNEQVVVATGYMVKSFNVQAKADDAERGSIQAFYGGDYLNRYKEQDPSVSSDSANALFSSLDGAAMFYQARYIGQNPHPIGSKQELMAAKKKGKFQQRYELYHGQYHDMFKQFQERFGFDDILLVSNEGRVVYSVVKNIDYATSLKDGALASSALGDAWQQSLSAEAGQIYLTDLSSYTPAYGAPTAFMSLPIFENGKRAGVLVFQVPLARMTSVMTSDKKWSEVGLGETGEVLLVGSDSRLRTDSRLLLESRDKYLQAIETTGWQDSMAEIGSRNTGVGLQKISSDSLQQALNGSTGIMLAQGYYGEEVLSAYTPLQVMGQKWALISEISSAEAFADEERILTAIAESSVIVIVVALLVAVAFGLLVSRLLINPLRELVDSFNEIAEGEGDLSIQLESAKRKDEIGDLSTAFNTFVKNIRSVVVEVTRTSAELAQVAANLQQSTGETSSSMGHQRQMTHSIASAMTEFAASIDEVARGSHETLGAMNQADEVTLSGSDSAQRSASEIDQLVGDTRQSAGSIARLSDEIDQISDILEVINGIAGQTSLLALNAAIEAARAGDQGRGFAVVADEVRLLSSRTQTATVDIQDKMEQLRATADESVSRVNSSMDNAERGIDLVNKTATELDQIRQLVGEVRSMHSQIASAVTEQQGAIKEIEQNVVEIDSLSETTLGGTEQAALSTEELRAMSERLRDLVGRFKTG